MKLLGIIPARGGSKGIKNKNMQLLDGKPLVLHAADTAIASGVLDRIILSTDDDAVIDCVKSRPEIEIPFKRPAQLAADNALIADAVAHLLDWLKEHEAYVPDAFMLLEPTCPLRTVNDIRQAVVCYQAAQQPCLIAVSAPVQHPSNMIQQKNGELQYCVERKPSTRGRQDFDPTWFINGAVYITQNEFFQTARKIYDLSVSVLYETPADRAFDINTPLDLALARAYLKIIKEEQIYA